jgi:hypothetical protein
MKKVTTTLIIIVALVAVVYVGLQVKPKSFAPPTLTSSEVKTMTLPLGLPKPVENFYRLTYGGNQIPVYDTVILTGTAHMRPFGIWLPARFVMVHNTGRDYRHYFEATFFGVPFLKINEGYVNGKSFFESPMATYYDDPNSNQGANLALWAEAAWFPSLWVTDPRTHWQAVDADTAILYVPYEDKEESFVVRFNPQTGMIDRMEAMRFQNPNDVNKILWITNEVPAHDDKPAVSYATWLDAGKPWASFVVENMQFNADVSQYINARGY